MPFEKGEIPEGAKPFKPGESGNPKGRPRKMVSQVIKELDAEGVEHVTKEQVRGAIEVLLNCKKEELIRYSSDENLNVLTRIVARHLVRSGDDDKIFNMLLDRAFGKPDTKTDITSGGVSLFDALTEDYESDSKEE